MQPESPAPPRDRLRIDGISAYRTLRRCGRRKGRRACRAYLAACALFIFCVAGAAGCAHRADLEDDLASDPTRRAEEIDTLRAAIERDHSTLEDLISRPRTAEEPPVHDDPEVLAIAARMTAQVDRLERLEAAELEPAGTP